MHACMGGGGGGHAPQGRALRFASPPPPFARAHTPFHAASPFNPPNQELLEKETLTGAQIQELLRRTNGGAGRRGTAPAA